MEKFNIGEKVKVKVATGFFEGIIEEIHDKKIVVKLPGLEMWIYAKREDVKKLNINKFTE